MLDFMILVVHVEKCMKAGVVILLGHLRLLDAWA